jgi:hypothetical protein
LVDADTFRVQARKVYSSWRWTQLAKKVVKKVGHCQDCGALPSPEVKLSADHIVPLSELAKHGDLMKQRLTFDNRNLRCLCTSCNTKRMHDWHGAPKPRSPMASIRLNNLDWLDEADD